MMDTAEAVGRNRSLQIAAGWVGAAAVLLWALAFARNFLYDFYQLRPWLPHPAMLIVGGCFAAAVACAMGVGKPWLRWTGVALFTAAGGSLAAMAYLLSGLSSPEMTELYRDPAPDGRMELIVYRSSAAFFPDPTRELRVRTREGLLSRESDLGCVNLDSNRLHSIQWTGPRTLRADLAREGIVEITLDTHGRPDTALGNC